MLLDMSGVEAGGCGWFSGGGDGSGESDGSRGGCGAFELLKKVDKLTCLCVSRG